MRILLTGGAGFIGSWVSDSLLKEGHELLIIDNLSTGLKSNIPEKAQFIMCDIRDRDSLEKVFREFKPECVNHHAAQMNVRASVDNPSYDAEVNILGSLNLLELSVSNKVKRFIFASSGGAIYGEPNVLPADESTVAVPVSPYGISKYSVEKYLYYYKEVQGLDYVSLRYANVYGPRQNPEGEAGVISIFCTKILDNEPCLIFGDGSQTRDYVYVSDVARANVISLNGRAGIYNVGTGVKTSVTDLIEILKNTSSGQVDVKHTDPRPGEVQDIYLNYKHISEILGWRPEIEIKSGIKRTWDWFKSSKTTQKQ